MRKKKAIVILIPGFAADETDSTCLPFHQSVIKTLARLNPKVRIIVIPFQYPYKSQPYLWNEIPVIPLNGRHKSGLLRLITWWKAWRHLQKINKKYDIKGILSFWVGECGLIGSRFARKNQLPHYCWIMGQDANKDNKYVKRIKLKKQELIALSDFLQNNFEENHHIRPAKVVTAGINPAEYKVKQTARDIDILGAGSLIPLKQFEIFIEVIKELKKDGTDMKAILCGKGPEEEKLQSLIVTDGLQHNIELKGEIAHADLLALMQHARVFLHPSSYEGFSGVCLEAIYAGAHVISFQKPMSEEI